MKSIVAWLICVQGVIGGNVDHLTFNPPFSSVGHDGRSQILNFKHGGVADINKYFVRLTPDRQSKQGFLWSDRPIDTDEFTAILQFRISGQGQRFFGDGIALWFSQTSHYGVGGGFHGAPEKFTGVGIIMDTFKNTETAALHKDVTLVVNDGQQSVDAMQQKSMGCDANLRYHEQRADFSVTNSSRIKISFKAKTLKIAVDAQASGEWTDCTTLDTLELPEGWHKSSYVAISAATGALADNHDVLSLNFFDGFDAAEAGELDLDFARKSTLSLQDRHGGDEIQILKSEILHLKQELEHKLEALEDGLKHSLKKLKEQEADDEKRITELESKLSSRIGTHVNDHMSKRLEEHATNMLGGLHTQMKDMEAKTRGLVEGHISKTGGGWKTPFFLLLVLIGGICFFVYRKWVELKKQHLL